MKKFFLLAILFVSVSSVSFAQGGKEKEGGFFQRLFKKEQKPRGQMKHFDKPKKDKNIKHNGTSYNRRKKERSRHKVDGDGFGTAGQPKRRKGKKTGIN